MMISASSTITTWRKKWPEATTRSLTCSPKTRRWIMIGVSVTPIASPASSTSVRYSRCCHTSMSPKRVGERERQQEPGQQLHARLHDPQLLEHVVPVAVEPLGLGLVALVLVGHPPTVPVGDRAAPHPD